MFYTERKIFENFNSFQSTFAAILVTFLFGAYGEISFVLSLLSFRFHLENSDAFYR